MDILFHVHNMIFDVNIFICLQGPAGERGPAGASGPAGPRVSDCLSKSLSHLLLSSITLILDKINIIHKKQDCTDTLSLMHAHDVRQAGQFCTHFALKSSCDFYSIGTCWI